jgi:hypothetical protein
MSRIRFIAPLAFIAALAFPAAALADNTDTHITISGGSLAYSTPFSAADFPATTLNGLPQAKTANISPWVVTDNRGTGAGWNVTISASAFTCTSGTCGSTQFPSGSLSLATVGVPSTDAANLLGPPPAIPPVYTAPLTPIDNGGSAQKIVSAAALPLNGSGAWTFTHAAGGLALVVPASTAPGTYTSTITTTLSSGP